VPKKEPKKVPKIASKFGQIRIPQRRLPTFIGRWTYYIKNINPHQWKNYLTREQVKNDQQYYYKNGEITLHLSLLLIYIGCRILREPIILYDIVLGAIQRKIPYLHSIDTFPTSFYEHCKVHIRFRRELHRFEEFFFVRNKFHFP